MKKGPNFLTNKTLLFVEVLVKTQLLANRYIYVYIYIYIIYIYIYIYIYINEKYNLFVGYAV
jgi:hypothetical protein